MLRTSHVFLFSKLGEDMNHRKQLDDRIREINDLIYSLNSTDEEIVDTYQMLSSVRDNDPDLFQYLINYNALHKTNYNFLKSRYFIILHKSMDVTNELHTRIKIQENIILSLEEKLENFKIIKNILMFLFILLIIIVFAYVIKSDPEAGNMIIKLLERIARLFSIFGG